MGFSERGTSNATFVRLAAGDEVSHSLRELLVAFNQVENVSYNERTVGASHVHLAVVVDGDGARQCGHVFVGSSPLVLHTCCLVFKDPLVGRVQLVTLIIQVVLDAQQILLHFWNINYLVCFFCADADNRHHS